VAAGQPAAAQGGWDTGTPLPAARNDAGAGVLRDSLYVVGGSVTDGAGVGTVEAYDPFTAGWSAKPAMPTARGGVAVATVGDSLYAVGGQHGGFHATVERYDRGGNAWQARASMPTARAYAGAGVVNGVVYVVGGNNESGWLGTLEAYDPSSNSWTTLTSMPTPRSRLAVAVVRDTLYAIGGVAVVGSTTVYYDIVEAYDPVMDRWSAKQSMPAARNLMAAGVVDDLVFVVGGAGASGVLASVEVFDPCRNEWKAVPDMPTARQTPAAGVIQGVHYVAGGYTGSARTAVLESFGPAPLVWSVADVGNDQGRQVRLAMRRAPRDAFGSPSPVVQYEAFRRIDAALAKAGGPDALGARPPGMISDPGILVAGWEFAGAIPAHGETEYNLIAPTLVDSTADAGIQYSSFFVRAATANPLVFFDSPPDSGYSVDNLAPAAPQGFAVAGVGSGGDIHFAWSPSPEVDFRYFTLYGAPSPDFVPGPANRLARTAANAWVHPGATFPGLYYKLTATDFAGNEGEFAAAELDLSGAGPGRPPETFAVRLEGRNPARDAVAVRYHLPSAGRVSVRVFDARGRQVRAFRDATEHEPGWSAWRWDLRDARGARVAPGAYWLRFETGAFSRTLRAVVVN
jgi:N-acetylneuraminic acid mutarotase